jgi:hypothetical protein
VLFELLLRNQNPLLKINKSLQFEQSQMWFDGLHHCYRTKYEEQ